MDFLFIQWFMKNSLLRFVIIFFFYSKNPISYIFIFLEINFILFRIVVCLGFFAIITTSKTPNEFIAHLIVEIFSCAAAAMGTCDCLYYGCHAITPDKLI